MQSRIIKIQKRAAKFYNHLKGSDYKTFHNKAITYREMNLEKSHLSKLEKKQSKLKCYLALNREYTVAEYLTTVTDPNLR